MFGLTEIIEMKGFENEPDMIDYLKDPVHLYERLGGVSFHNDSLNNFTYAIRLSYAPRNSGEAGLELFFRT